MFSTSVQQMMNNTYHMTNYTLPIFSLFQFLHDLKKNLNYNGNYWDKSALLRKVNRM
jgi:hypothetical protein